MKILVADDDRIELKLLASTLRRWNYEVVQAENGEAAWEILQKAEAPQLAILDWMMPGIDGIEICRRLRQQGRQPYAYVLLLTSRNQKEDTVQGLESGADDFIIKPYHPMELQARLHAGERILRLQSELLEVQEQLRFQATHDALTGLWNRRMILDWLQREIERCQREESDLAVLMMDADHFKQVNDRYGHLAGDSVLREISARMKSTLRSYDGLGRYGGEEFLAVLSNCGEAAAKDAAERLRLQVRETPVLFEELSIQVSVSLGIAISHAGRRPNATRILHDADAALYQAKRDGRDCVRVASPDEEP